MENARGKSIPAGPTVDPVVCLGRLVDLRQRQLIEVSSHRSNGFRLIDSEQEFSGFCTPFLSAQARG